MGADRERSWAGSANVRDLGGLPLVAGGETARGRVFRSASVDPLTRRGWADVREEGIATVVDLRGDWERIPTPQRPSELPLVSAPLEDVEDPFYAMWDGRHGTMDYFRAGIGHWPEYWATALETIAAASDGPLLVHCAAGRDRTGAISALLLSVAGVQREAILDDYEAGIRGAPAREAERDILLRDAREQMGRLLDLDLPDAVADPARRAATRLIAG